jgi:hypothetical protein
MTPRQGLSPAALRTILKGVHFVDIQANREWLGGAAPGLVPAADRVARIMVSNGLLKQVPTLEGLADPRFLPGS